MPLSRSGDIRSLRFEQVLQGIQSVDDLKNVDIEDLKGIDPDKIKLGTDLEDCMLIVQTFERGAHSTPSEAAVFASLHSSLENSKAISRSVMKSMDNYLTPPAVSSGDTIASTSKFAAEAGVVVQTPSGQGTDGTSTPTDEMHRGLEIPGFTTMENTFYTMAGQSAGDAVMTAIRDCIPCLLRISSYLELYPHPNIINMLKKHLFDGIANILSVARVLSNVSIWNDFCALLNFLSFMCIPDLQRLLSLLMALFMLEWPTLDGLVGMLRGLIAPLLMPLLMCLLSLLDLFVLIVRNPLDCIIDSLNEQLNKVWYEIGPDSKVEQWRATVGSGVATLNEFMVKARDRIDARMDMYMSECRALMGGLNENDTIYIASQLRKLQLVRMIMFITSVILAITKGHSACSGSGRSPENEELNNFFDNFVNPHGPFTAFVDPEGNIVVEEKVPELAGTLKELPGIQDVLEFEGTELMEFRETFQQTAAILTEPTRAVIPCHLEVTTDEVAMIREYMAELNSV
jgi:hypothetical protein